MYCAQDNRIYCSDCNKSYIPNNNSNHLKSKGHYINVMKKQCCSCNNDINHCDNHDLTCSMNKLSLESNNSIKTDFSNVKNNTRSDQTKTKVIEKYKNVDPDILLVKFRNLYTGNYRDSKSVTEAKAMLEELNRFKGITWGEHVFCLDGYIHKDKDEN